MNKFVAVTGLSNREFLEAYARPDASAFGGRR